MIEIRHASIQSADDSQHAYDTLYAEQGIHQRRSFYAWLISLLSTQPGQRLLDISCGEGMLLHFAQGRKLEAWGIDFSAAAVARSQILVTGSHVVVGNAQALPYPAGSFDYVTNIGSLEHYWDPAEGMREIRRVLKAEGIACILLPNTYSITGNVVHAWRTGDIFDDGQPLQRYHTRKGWQQLLEANGLHVFKTYKYELEWPRNGRDIIWYLTHPAKLVRLFLTPFIPLNLANCLVYLCKPATFFQ